MLHRFLCDHRGLSASVYAFFYIVCDHGTRIVGTVFAEGVTVFFTAGAERTRPAELHDGIASAAMTDDIRRFERSAGKGTVKIDCRPDFGRILGLGRAIDVTPPAVVSAKAAFFTRTNPMQYLLRDDCQFSDGIAQRRGTRRGIGAFQCCQRCLSDKIRFRYDCA